MHVRDQGKGTAKRQYKDTISGRENRRIDITPTHSSELGCLALVRFCNPLLGFIRLIQVVVLVVLCTLQGQLKGEAILCDLIDPYSRGHLVLISPDCVLTHLISCAGRPTFSETPARRCSELMDPVRESEHWASVIVLLRTTLLLPSRNTPDSAALKIVFPRATFCEPSNRTASNTKAENALLSRTCTELPSTKIGTWLTPAMFPR